MAGMPRPHGSGRVRENLDLFRSDWLVRKLSHLHSIMSD